MPAHVRAIQTPTELEQAKALRIRVFVEEQGVPRDIELDEADASAFHAVALQGPIVVGTGRLLMDSPMEARIGRMAVEQPQRRHGVGGQILAFLEDEARRRGVRKVTLHAQAYVKAFYAAHGYVEQGQPFTEAGILHVAMAKDLWVLLGNCIVQKDALTSLPQSLSPLRREGNLSPLPVAGKGRGLGQFC